MRFLAVHCRAILLLLLLVMPLSANAGAGSKAEPFPLYPVLRVNVAFWEKVYSTYSINSAVIHDRRDLSKVYEVVQLMDRELPTAARVNSAITNSAIEKYQIILKSLAAGKGPVTTSEKRVAQMFQGSGRRQLMLAADEVRSQIGQKERFYQGVVRSGRYIDSIKRIFRSHGLPEELAYLPHVESSFDNSAYSKAGASGMWQFTLGTGKRYMHIDDALDERSDPLIAAAAAARYLRDGHDKLGSWPLALTAYNYGTAGMVRAREAKGSYERIFREYQEGNFGFASRNFYSEFLAALRVASQLESSRIQRDRPIHFVEYVLPGYMHINDIRRHFKLSEVVLQQLNPAIRPPVYSGHKLLPSGYPLRLPPDQTTRSLMAKVPHSALQHGQIRDKVHQVKPGETLIRIAAKHGLSVKVLAAANGLPQDARVRIGQRLKIPPRTTGIAPASQPSALTAAGTKRLIDPDRSARQAASASPLVLSAEPSKIQRTTAN